MKKIVTILICFSLCIIFCGCDVHNNDTQALLRIHIRANSNASADQQVKLKVRDAVNDYLERELDGVKTFDEAYKKLSQKLAVINKTAGDVLARNGFKYGVRVKLNNEFFPTRAYGDIVIESGYYDALIIELGEGKGDNWWCVIYPPLCYVKPCGEGNIQYKSLIKELWEKYFGKN
ncbi:MAG: stage II sporulation protein R [Clostridia bacterium]|nr:stage II sporulation protein R [Clostridia bacterium]